MFLDKIDPPPHQAKYSEDDVRSMKVRRQQLRTDWRTPIHPPESPGENWRIVLPFPNTYKNAFLSMCEVNAYAHEARGGRLCIFLNGTEGDDEPPSQVLDWIDIVREPVAMKDYLAISFALDYEREGGNPEKEQTKIGALRAQAKPYGSNVATAETKRAAEQLAQYCVEFLEKMTCYGSADCVVAMPPSDPAKEYNLPRYLAKQIAAQLKLEDMTKYVTTVEARGSLKGLRLSDKLGALVGTVEVKPKVFADRHVLIVDDLYQSGTSLNYCGYLLLKAGAEKIFGLACEKTCRNDDNVGRG